VACSSGGGTTLAQTIRNHFRLRVRTDRDVGRWPVQFAIARR
jgi:hypothetical protein